MKKFFSLLCAAVIALSASAVPAKTLGKDMKLDAVKSAPAKTVKMESKLQKADRAVAFRAPQAKQETYNLTADSYAERFYTADNDVYVKLFTDDFTFYFDVIVDEGTQVLALDSVYDLASMLTNYSYLRDSNNTKILYTAATLKKYITTYEDQELVNFTAAVTDENGDIYNIVYNQAPFIITGDTVEIAFTKCMNKPLFADSLTQVRATDDTNDVAFCYTIITEGSVAGTFGPEAMNLDYTFVNGMEAKEAHCVVTEGANGHIDLEGWILASDGNVYHVTMFFDVPTAQSQETITATNLTVEDMYAAWFGVVWADASNEDYSVEVTFYAEDASEILGTFDLDDLYGVDIVDLVDSAAIDLYSGTITVAYANGSYVITGTVLGMNSVEYTLNLSYVLPDPTSFETLNGAGVLYLEAQDDMYYWQAAAINADKTRYISLLAITDGNDAGTYSKADLYASYTYAGKFIGADTTWYDMLDANITLVINNDVATITGTFLGQSDVDAADVTEFTLNLSLEVNDERGNGGNEGSEYDAEEAFKHVFPTYTVNDQYLAQYNALVVEATDEESNTISLDFNVEAGTTTLAPGVYSITDTYAANTVSTGYINQYIYGSFAGSVDEEGYINIPLWLIFNGTVTVHENGVIEVNAINTKGSIIECLLGQWPEGIENTAVDAAATKAVRNGQLVIIKNGVEYNAQGAMIK